MAYILELLGFGGVNSAPVRPAATASSLSARF